MLVRTARAMGLDNTMGKLFVGLSDEGLSEGRITSNNCECDAMVSGAIQAFNGHQDVGQLRDLHHSCKDSWRKYEIPDLDDLLL